MHRRTPKRRCQFFEPAEDSLAEMHKALAEIVSLNQKMVLASFMVEENMLHYKHGIRWSTPANSFSGDGEMEKLSAEYSVSFQQILDGDFSLLTDSITSISKQMSDGFQKRIYETMNEACDRSGNVVKGKDLPQSFLEALEKIDFSVDKNGVVQPPQFHVGSSFQMKDLQDQPKEFHDRVNEIKERKSAAALEIERERISRFKTISE